MVFFNMRDETFVVYKSCLKAVGVWPMERCKCGTAVIFWTTTILQFIILTIHLVDPLGKCPAYGFKAEGFQITVWKLSTLMMRINFRMTWDRVSSLINAIADDWSSIVDPEERDIMIRHDRYGSAMCLVHAVIILVVPDIWLFIALPYINVIETSPNSRTTCAFDHDFTLASFSASINFVVYVSDGIMYWSTKTLSWSIAMHLSGQYKILKARFQDLLSIEDKGECRSVLRRLVERHNQLLLLCSNHESSFNVYNTISIFSCQTTVCVYAILLIDDIKSINFGQGVKDITFLIVTLALISTVYYASDYLTACCEEVGEVFTQCNWYDLSKELRTNYSIVSSRCRKPVRFSALKIYKLNLSDFKYVLQTLYSYISVIAAITKQ